MARYAAKIRGTVSSGLSGGSVGGGFSHRERAFRFEESPFFFGRFVYFFFYFCLFLLISMFFVYIWSRNSSISISKYYHRNGLENVEDLNALYSFPH